MSFSFLFGNNNSSSGNGIYSLLSEYNNIKSGTYYKVVKAYYAKQAGSTEAAKNSTAKDKTNTALQSEKTKELNKTQSDAKALSEAAGALISRGSSLFQEKDITTKGEDGKETTTKGYDMDAIYGAVKKFADSYNNLVDSASKSTSKTVRNQANNMVSGTKTYEKMLNKVGITIGSDNKLSVNEKDFKAADIITIKTLFNGNASFANNAASRASMISYSAQSEANKNSLYTNRGNYNNAYSTGSWMNSFF